MESEEYNSNIEALADELNSTDKQTDKERLSEIEEKIMLLKMERASILSPKSFDNDELKAMLWGDGYGN